MAENKNKTTELKKVIELIDENKRAFAYKLFDRAVFMEKTLCKLEKTIKKEGAVITGVNGNGFEVTSEHPAQKSYNTMIGKYNALIKSIVELIPEASRSDGDELVEFIRAGKV